jgi:hypothetical protein
MLRIRKGGTDMDQSIFTIYFDDPYWVGIFELTVDGCYSIARVVFGAEPTDAQILEYLSKNYPNQVRFATSSETQIQKLKDHINPKRKQREAAQLLARNGGSTKAQEALQQAHESRKQERQQEQKLLKEEIERLRYLQKVEKKKQKKRGR